MPCQSDQNNVKIKVRNEVVTMGRDDSSYLNLQDEFDQGGNMNDDDGHVSDPGNREVEFWASPRLKRSCSDLVVCLCHDDTTHAGSQVTRRSADKVILKKHSSSQILPSHSRKLWWKLFLWNLDKPASNPSFNQQGGYCLDTVELRPTEKASSKLPLACSEDLIKTGNHSRMWTQNQWIALPIESSAFNRVEEWVKGISCQASLHEDCDNIGQPCILYPPSPAESTSPARASFELAQYPPVVSIPDEVLHANSIIQSFNASSSVAHMTDIGLKVIPSISGFSSLRSVNLSSNYIVHIHPGSLPKGLYELNLSRNKINVIEGLRELTQLRMLDLSYNRISRIGQGLSNCTLIKELYLSGNKISHVEGLHRLVKLTVLDLSFNKITTSKALGHLVANYNSLMTINLLGNPIQSNNSDEQLRRMVCSLVPKVGYLNKQAVNTQKAREAMAALGGSNSNSNTRRKSGRKVQRQVSMATSASTRRHNAAGADQKAKLRATKSFPQHRSTSTGGAAVQRRPHQTRYD